MIHNWKPNLQALESISKEDRIPDKHLGRVLILFASLRRACCVSRSCHGPTNCHCQYMFNIIPARSHRKLKPSVFLDSSFNQQSTVLLHSHAEMWVVYVTEFLDGSYSSFTVLGVSYAMSHGESHSYSLRLTVGYPRHRSERHPARLFPKDPSLESESSPWPLVAYVLRAACLWNKYLSTVYP